MDRYFNNGTGVPMSEDDYYEYTAENDLPEEYELSQEEKDYLVGKTFDLFYYVSSDSEENITTLNTLESGQHSMETKEKKNY